MGSYTPPVINNGDPFDPTVTRGGFDDFATAINFDVDTNNLSAGSLPATSFHKTALTETWKFSNDLVTQSCPVRHDGAGTADTTLVQTGRNFSMLNRFDIEDACGRIYLQRSADILVTASVDFKYAKTTSWAATIFTHLPQAYLYMDTTASSLEARQFRVVENGADAHRRPLNVVLQATQTAVAAGWHDYHVSVDFTAGTDTGVAEFIHWLCTGRSLNILALYR